MFLNGGGDGVTWVLSVGSVFMSWVMLFFLCVGRQCHFGIRSNSGRGGLPFPVAITRGPGLFQEEDIQLPLKTQSKLNKQESPCHFLFFLIFLFSFLKCILGSRGWKCLGPVSPVSFLFQSEPSIRGSQKGRINWVP